MFSASYPKNAYEGTPAASAGLRRYLDVRFFNVLAALAVALLFVGYLAMNNASATMGFAIKSLEYEISDLEEQRKTLDLEMVSQQSMENIEKAVETLGFVPVTAVEYLKAAGGAVAVK